MDEGHEQDSSEIEARPNDELARYIGFRYALHPSKTIALMEAASQFEGTDFP